VQPVQVVGAVAGKVDDADPARRELGGQRAGDVAQR
jgi:hypothetical protein